jgi:hypothetical protein
LSSDNFSIRDRIQPKTESFLMSSNGKHNSTPDSGLGKVKPVSSPQAANIARKVLLQSTKTLTDEVSVESV